MNVDALENRWLRLGLRLLLGAVFVYAGSMKFVAPQHLADSIATFRLLPPPLISLLALTLPCFELTVGGLLLTGWHLRVASLAVLGMTGIFVVALLFAVARGLPIECGCFGGSAASRFGKWALVRRDSILCIAALLLYWQECGDGRRHTMNATYTDPEA